MKDVGTIYVLANRDSSLAKVGITRNGTPDARADDYSRTHGIQWHVYWSARTLDVAAAEASAHRELQAQRFSLTPDAREIFHVTPEKAQRIAARYVMAPDTDAGIPAMRRPAWADTAAYFLPLVLSAFPAGRRLHRRLRSLHALFR